MEKNDFFEYNELNNDEKNYNYTPFSVSKFWIEEYYSENLNPNDYYEKVKVEKYIYDLVFNYKNNFLQLKKIPKKNLLNLYLFLREKLIEKFKMNEKDIFVEICYFFDINVKKVYKILPDDIKIKIKNELYNIYYKNKKLNNNE